MESLLLSSSNIDRPFSRSSRRATGPTPQSLKTRLHRAPTRRLHPRNGGGLGKSHGSSISDPRD
ncbi:hypothetical protein CC_0592 [Caulobacter vibrioides CB15]|uniref:Uncharacterized protein n=1 Tax=Caulobacter vibrioides (strain ATCC 19089 / CIP 103742 / CB 15) TaxID=190650 RepID=Q9AAK5_CAUVC|nr:hypothetical protein CC_0592 [Caulobacter vibrioides CB15]ATC30585.1 hypothetical protein CA607_03165 [Caulobacter vibrioides]